MEAKKGNGEMLVFVATVMQKSFAELIKKENLFLASSEDADERKYSLI